MKRLVWLVLLAFGTALAQVQPVDLSVTQDKGCCCCEDQAGACGMPDCLPQPVTSQTVVLPAVAGQRSETRRLSPAPRQKRECFYIQFVPRTSLASAWSTPVWAESAAVVPLFKAHCSYLI